MRATVWSDYCCPWCYLALDRVDLLVDLGVEVTIGPYELHPETPLDGRPHAPGRRTARVFAEVGTECERAGLPFSMPARTPNTRRVLAVADHVRRTEPTAFERLHRALFSAHFADGQDIGDPAVLDDLVAAAGADPVAAQDSIASGEATAALDAARFEANEAGVSGTPAFAFAAEGLVIPGVQPRETMERWVTRLVARETV